MRELGHACKLCIHLLATTNKYTFNIFSLRFECCLSSNSALRASFTSHHHHQRSAALFCAVPIHHSLLLCIIVNILKQRNSLASALLSHMQQHHKNCTVKADGRGRRMMKMRMIIYRTSLRLIIWRNNLTVIWRPWLSLSWMIKCSFSFTYLSLYFNLFKSNVQRERSTIAFSVRVRVETS